MNGRDLYSRNQVLKTKMPLENFSRGFRGTTGFTMKGCVGSYRKCWFGSGSDLFFTVNYPSATDERISGSEDSFGFIIENLFCAYFTTLNEYPLIISAAC